MACRPQPYRLDPPVNEETLPAIITNADEMFQTLFEDLNALCDTVDTLETAVNASGSGGSSTTPGPAGPPGIEGAPGEPGDRGAQGVAGVAGVAGIAGIAGPIGMWGWDGTDGTDGMIGATGPRGVAGTDATVVQKTANYGAAAWEVVECISGTFTVTLPAANSNAHKPIWVVNSGTGVITVARSGTDTIGLLPSLTLVAGLSSNEGDAVALMSNNAGNWVILAERRATVAVKDAANIFTALNTFALSADPSMTVTGSRTANHFSQRIYNTSTDGYSTLWVGPGNDGFIRGGATAAAFTNQLVFLTSGTTDVGFVVNNTMRLLIAGGGANDGRITMSKYGAGVANFDASGNISSVSDERMKNVLGAFTVGLPEVLKIRPIRYTYKPESGLDVENTYAGFSAQNVVQYIPEAVGIDPEGFYTLAERPILAALVNAIQTLAAEVQVLRNAAGIPRVTPDPPPLQGDVRVVRSRPVPKIVYPPGTGGGSRTPR